MRKNLVLSWLKAPVEEEVTSPITCADTFDPVDPHALFTDRAAIGPMVIWAWFCPFSKKFRKREIRGSTQLAELKTVEEAIAYEIRQGWEKVRVYTND